MLTLYSQQRSGNAYKPRLLMAQLGIPFRIIEVNSYDGSTRRPEFLDKNPIGKVPLLEFPDGQRLAESNAMLLHLAEDTAFLPATGSIEPNATSGCSSSSTATSRRSPSGAPS
jgi:glutathione S-transferase